MPQLEVELAEVSDSRPESSVVGSLEQASNQLEASKVSEVGLDTRRSQDQLAASFHSLSRSLGVVEINCPVANTFHVHSHV